MKKYLYIIGAILFILNITKLCDSAAIPKKAANEETNNEQPAAEEEGENWENSLEYGRYLKEIVQALESDPEFRKKLEGANVEDIKSGKIARELHFVDHGIRTTLDELKRQELERLRHLAVQEHEKQNGVDRNRLKIPGHIDIKSPKRFEVEDLRKLIVQTTKDLEEADIKRREEFKKYEMEKDFQFNESLRTMDEQHRIEMQKKRGMESQKHSEHVKLHHPGSKQQLEEVWEEQDHMSKDDFDPKLFFKLHDLDNNGYWDQVEVKALFKKELDKMYDPNNPEDDINERYEEMERMREHVFKESDQNRDSLISYEEFLEQAKKTEFEQDEGWVGLDDQEVYNQQEYEAYERQRQQEIQRLVQEGKIPPPAYYNVPPPPHGMQAVPVVPGPQGYQQIPQGYQPVPQGYQPVPQQYQGVPQGYQPVQQGYQAVPQGIPQGVPQGYQQIPQPHQGVPQGHQGVPQGYQQVPQSHQGMPQGNIPNPNLPPQAYQQVPQINSNALPVNPHQPKIEPGANVNAPPQPIGGHEAVPNPGIPNNAVPQVQQHLDAVPQQQEQNQQQHQQPQQQQQQQQQHQQPPQPHQGAPPNVVGQQPHVINNGQGQN